MITYVAPAGEESWVEPDLADQDGSTRDRVRVVSYTQLETRTRLEAGAWIFCGLDQVTAGQRELADLVWRTLDASGMPVRLLNGPRAVLLQAPLLAALRQTKIHRVRAVTPEQRFSELRYPVCVKERYAYTGSLTSLLQDRSALDSALGKLRLRGYRNSELLIVEISDAPDPDGVYRRYSASYLGGAVVPAELRFSTDWRVPPEGSFWDEGKIREERDWAGRTGWHRAVARIFRVANVEYGRIEFTVVDGKIEVWTMDTKPALAPASGIYAAKPGLDTDRAALRTDLQSRVWERVLGLEPEAWGRMATPFSPPVVLLDRIRKERRSRDRRNRRLRRRAFVLERLGGFRPFGRPGVDVLTPRLARFEP